MRVRKSGSGRIMTYGNDQYAMVSYRPQTLAVPMPSQHPPMQPDAPEAGLVQMLWRRKWTILLFTLLGIAAGFVYLKNTERVYRSTARLAIEPAAEIAFTVG